MKNNWRIWAKALGEKAHKKDHIADQVASVRTVIFLTYLITNCFIVAGVIRHWNDVPQPLDKQETTCYHLQEDKWTKQN